ncbi:hypothetical protein LCGC14_2582730 [marine sediment metagenome]|uniref:Uncharacterized protein n=1 Tax=marine sediment metagenome TaxID=412755 RepID=A0A0F9B1Y8_9ZZZZ
MNVQPVLDASVELMTFVKTNEYPKLLSVEFVELTNLFNNLETALRTSGIIPRTGSWPKSTKDES